MLNRSKLALIGFACIVGSWPATPAFAQYDPFTQCLIDHCFGNYEGDPAGYRRCWQWCAAQTGGPYVVQPQRTEPVAKLD